MTRSLLALLLAVVVSGCAQPAPPLLTLSGRSCEAAPALGPATPVPYDSRTGVVVPFGPNSPCLDTGGGRTVTYAVFGLPPVTGPYQLTISSEIVGHAVIAPVAQIYDVSGGKGRHLDTAEFRQDITGFTAGLRAQAADRVLIVSADPATVGQPTILRLGARVVGTQIAAAVLIPIIVVAPVQDQLRERGATLALNGQVRVVATPIPTVP